MQDFDAESYLGIDTSILDQEIAEQPLKYERLSRALADCNFLMDTKSQEIELVEAEKALNLRQKAVEANQKLTEKTIEQSLAADITVMKLKKEKQTLKHKKEVLSGMVQAMIHRKDALKSLAFSRYHEENLVDKNETLF